MMKKRSLLFLSMVLVLSVFLAACAGKGNNAGSSKDGEKATQDLSINIKKIAANFTPWLSRGFNFRDSSSSST